MSGMRRFAQNQWPAQTIAVIRSLRCTLHLDASGVTKSAPPMASGGQESRKKRWGMIRGRGMRCGAAATNERRRCGRIRGAERSAGALRRSAGASARVQRAVRGEAGTRRRTGCTGASRGDARSRRSRPGRAKRSLRRVLCEAQARGERGGDASTAVECRAGGGGPASGGERSEPLGKRASGQAGKRSERSERRREGYPPEGARPRSGLDRVARSRSDAPSLIVGSRETVSMDGTI